MPEGKLFVSIQLYFRFVFFFYSFLSAPDSIVLRCIVNKKSLACPFLPFAIIMVIENDFYFPCVFFFCFVYYYYYVITFVVHLFSEIEASFPYRDVQLKKGPISTDIYDISKKELGR